MRTSRTSSGSICGVGGWNGDGQRGGSGVGGAPSGGFKTAHSWQWRRFYDFRANRAEWARRVRVVRREGRETGRAAGATRASEASHAPESTYRGRHCTLAGRWRRRRAPRGSTARQRPRTPRRRVDASRLISEVGEVEPANRARGRAIGARDGRVRGRAQSRRGEGECGSIARAVARVDPPPVAGRSRQGLRRRIFRASATKRFEPRGVDGSRT